MDEIMDYYLEIGAIEISGVDKDGEILFSITEKAKELAPELWQSHQEHIVSLWFSFDILVYLVT